MKRLYNCEIYCRNLYFI